MEFLSPFDILDILEIPYTTSWGSMMGAHDRVASPRKVGESEPCFFAGEQ